VEQVRRRHGSANTAQYFSDERSARLTYHGYGSRRLLVARRVSVVTYRSMPDDERATPDGLRFLLNQITYHFGANKKAMHKTRSTLLALIGRFANDELKRSGSARKNHTKN
jgi:hypothetical protein